MKIKYKLMLGFTSILIIIIALSIILIFKMKSSFLYRERIWYTYSEIRAINKVELALSEQVNYLYNYLLFQNAESIENIDRIKTKIKQLWNEWEDLISEEIILIDEYNFYNEYKEDIYSEQEEKETYTKLITWFDDINSIFNEIIELNNSGDYNKSLLLFNNFLSEKYNENSDKKKLFTHLIDIELSEINRIFVSAKISEDIFSVIVFIAIIFAVIIVIIVSLVIGKTVSAPILKLKNAVEEFGKDNLDIRLKIKSKDEFAILADSFNLMTEEKKINEQQKSDEMRIKERIYILNNELHKIRNGNLDKKLDKISESIQAFLNAEIVTVFLKNKDNKNNYIITAYTGNDKHKNTIKYLVNKINNEAIINTKKELDSFLYDNDKINLQEFKIADIQFPFAIMYLTNKKDKTGLIYVYCKTGFFEKDIHFLENLTKIIEREVFDEESYRKIKQIEEEKVEKEKMLIKAERLISFGNLVSTIGHEIYQPLNSMKIIAQGPIYLQQKNKKQSYDELIDNFKKILERIENITDIIKNMKSIIKNPENIRIEKIKINETILNITNTYENKLNKNNIKLELILSDEIYPVNFSQNQLEQVIINLLDNAFNVLTHHNTENKIIKIVTERSGENTVLKIIDNGPGINDDIKEKIFEPYFSTDTNNEGTGLGLYIVRLILKAYNIKITANDNKYGGTTFIIVFNK